MLKNFLGIILFSIGVSFLLINILYSQLISPLYFQQVTDEKKSIVSYLRSIRPLPEFRQQLVQYKNLYGTSIEEGVFYDENLRNEKIKEYEDLLTLNPKASDVLYNLYILYGKNGDEEKARNYLERARAVNPNL